MSASQLQVFYEPDHLVPLVDLQLYLKMGAASDPLHRAGLCCLASHLVRSGTAQLSRVEVPAAWDARGARLSAGVSLSYSSLHLTCLREQISASVELFASLLREPALRKEDLAFHQRDHHQSRLARREDPQALAARAITLAVFGTHPYSRGTLGTELEMARVTVDDIRHYLEQRLVRGNVVIGCSGDLDQAEAEGLVQQQFAWIPPGDITDTTPEVEHPRRTAVVIEMQEQSQAHLYVGTTGAIVGQPEFDPWRLATVVFGGVFSSRLTQEIRELHGFSYEANASLHFGRQRNIWRTYSFPSLENLGDCLRVQLDMIAALREFGITEKEMRDTKRYLEQSQCFDRETACKRLDPRLDEAIFGLPSGWFDAGIARIRTVQNADIVSVLRSNLPDERLCVGVAGPPGTAKIIDKAFLPDHLMVLTPEAAAS